MNENRHIWSMARERLTVAVTSMGFPAELAHLMAQQLGSPKAIDRMTSYIYQAHPRSEEMLVDEMLSICDEIDAWRKKKTGQQAQASYTALRWYGQLGQEEEDEEGFTRE